ncbi:hypothetical protein NPX13_g10701 [Xylaria arbuscula]|uniref:Uncharacterized protein n=1 Tax=Xylaria arbuscula TaxID=114810 RepID=A0A9W8TGC5_9PEZI|nr:hypothetical protein NPX13_g10701 [Xylaria arbuscula]
MRLSKDCGQRTHGKSPNDRRPVVPGAAFTLSAHFGPKPNPFQFLTASGRKPGLLANVEAHIPTPPPTEYDPDIRPADEAVNKTMARLHYIQAFMNYLQVLVWNYSLVVARYITRLTNTPSLKPTTRREIQYLLTMAEEDDKRPDTSPFAGFTTQIYFREGPDFVVPTSLIRKCPKLVPEKARWPPSAIRLDDITASIAHVIFYYLLTGTYQSLRPKGTSSHERLGDELKTGVQSYNAARTYDLPELQELAKDEIQRLAQELPFPLVLNLLRNLHLDPYEREAWLDDYVQSGLKNLFQTPTAFLDLTATQVENDVVSFSNIILKSLANLLSNESALSHKDIVVTPAATPEPAAIEAEPNHEEPLREQLLPEDEPVLVEVDTRIEEPNNEVQVQDQVEQPAPPEVEWEPTPMTSTTTHSSINRTRAGI